MSTHNKVLNSHRLTRPINADMTANKALQQTANAAAEFCRYTLIQVSNVEVIMSEFENRGNEIRSLAKALV